jgi:hypothetical protein
MLTLSFALLQLGCDSPNPPEKLDGAVLDAEVARRVAQIELEQRLDDLERKLEQQALTVEEKNRLIEDQRILLEEKNRADAGQLTSDPLLPPVEKSVPTQDLTQEPTRKPVQQITRTTTTGVGVNAGADYAMFYEKLEPHGTWIETPQYGAIWQPAPRYTPVGWQPYTRGSWTYADVGWTWVSAEPFGWATYHYGRWNNVSNRGWCWIPGNQWAPAWVSWRTGSNYVGWAPLPAQSRFLGNRISVQFGNDFDSGPGNYCFVPSRFFGSSSVYRHVVPNARNTVIIADTVNVTNIVRADDIVINQGPDYTELNRVAASPIRTARLIRNQKVPPGNAPGATWSGNNLNVAAPAIKAANPAQRSALQRADRITRLESVNGWEQVKSPVERQRLREQLARQNQRTQAREQAIAAAPSATQPPVAAKENPIEQRAQQEAQARRIAAQAERERLIAASRQDVAATPANPAVRSVPQTPQTQAQREAALRREQAQKERERLANVAAAKQQATIAKQQTQQQPQPQQQVVAPRPTAIVAPPKVSPASTQAAREAQSRRDQAQREREQKARAEAARQQVAINQRQAAQAARQTAPSRPVNQLQQRPQQVAQRPPAQQQQRPSAPAQPSAAQVQAARQAQARREAAQAERERSARQEALSQQRAQAQRQQLAAQRQNQPVRQQQITPAQQQRIDAAQRQRQQQMQRQQQPN